jgi:PhnB protein
MQINAYLNYDGQCREAFQLYERVLGGQITMVHTFGESPMGDQTPPDYKDRVMHVRLELGDQVLMGSDAPPPHFDKPQGFSISIGVDDVAEAERIFNQLSEGGQVTMSLQKTFWAERFAMFVDRYGTPWMVNCESASS